jgi:HEAT repeat protein
VVRELIRALGDENSDVADVAETALIEIGRATMPELTIALNDQRLEKTPRSRVAKTLGRLGDEHAMPILLDALLNSPPEELEGYVEAMAGVGPAAVPTLIAALAAKDVTTGAGLVASWSNRRTRCVCR